jgi:hypothetical protein
MRGSSLLLVFVIGCGSGFGADDPPDAAPDSPAADAPSEVLGDGYADAPSDELAQDGAAVDVVHPDADAGDAGELPDVSPDAPSDACALVTHHTGAGATWQNCTPLGTFDHAEALDACTAQTGDATDCAPLNANGYFWMCASQNGYSPCYCWAYTGPDAGTVNLGQQGCEPGLGASAQWD